MTTTFSFGGFRGEISDRFAPVDLEMELRRLMDPASAVRTLHWGRNYLYEAVMRCREREERVVVKAFRGESAARRVRRRWRGSKAERTWRVSHAMLESGILVPEPIALLDSTRPDGPSFFISRLVENALEARFLFRAMNARREQELFPDIDVDAFLVALGGLLRRLHDESFWHRDISPGNILLVTAGAAAGATAMYLVDLNRTRAGKTLSISERMRDLSRLPVFSPSHRDRLLQSYWGESTVRGRSLYRLYHHCFLAKNRAKRGLRGGGSRLRQLLPRTRHVHIEAPESGAGARDRIVWDELSHQPHQHAGAMTKLKVRLTDGGSHLRAAASVVPAVPRILSCYRRIRADLHQRSVPWPEPGICIGPSEGTFEEIEPLLEGLGTRRVLLRLHPWEDDLSASEALARELHGRGYELAFSVPQNRDLVRDLTRWRAALEEIEERFLKFGQHVQVGHAINRSKWGIWNPKEYERLMGVANDVLKRRCAVKILGPAVIDFELHQTAIVLNSPSEDLRFDIVSSLLYVDRRGAPENRQAGFDTIDKVVLLKAVVQGSRHGDRPCWITEVNWPLAEGPHSPAGRAVVVDEESQANYLVRYYLLTEGTGLIERVYWWQLVARGYGLINPIDGVFLCRPSYRAFQHMAERLRGTRLTRRLHSGTDAHLYLLEREDGRELVVGWVSRTAGEEVQLPRAVHEVYDRDGKRIGGLRGSTARLTPAPQYFELVDS